MFCSVWHSLISFRQRRWQLYHEILTGRRMAFLMLFFFKAFSLQAIFVLVFLRNKTRYSYEKLMSINSETPPFDFKAKLDNPKVVGNNWMDPLCKCCVFSLPVKNMSDTISLPLGWFVLINFLLRTSTRDKLRNHPKDTLQTCPHQTHLTLPYIAKNLITSLYPHLSRRCQQGFSTTF